MKISNLERNSGLVELNSQELEITDGGIVIVSALAVAGYFLGGVVVGAAIGYGVSAAIEGIEGWFD
jgi:lactobin A/cerein 7B family class IIb bacteriocin